MSQTSAHCEKPWQNSLYGSEDKLRALYYNGFISDLTITFPGTDIKLKAHKVILAMSSSIFERMLFGPMAITGSELELPDDNPQAFKIILAHCYEIDIGPSNINVALDVYMLADKYYLEDFLKKFKYTIGHMLNSDNINQVLEFASNFNFNSLKNKCFDIFGKKYKGRYDYKYDSNEIDIPDASKALLCLRPEWLKELLKKNNTIPEIVFERSWYFPDEILCEKNILEVLQSKNCRKNGLERFVGCVSAKVVESICKVSYKPENDSKYSFKHLYLSFTDLQQANESLSILEGVEFRLILFIHLQCDKIPADGLRQLSVEKIIPLINKWNLPTLFLSDVDDDGIDWVVSAVRSLKPPSGCISFPRSNLTLDGLKSLLAQLAMVFGDIGLPDIKVCSPKILTDSDGYYWGTQMELDRWSKANSIKFSAGYGTRIELCKSNEKISDWKI